mgnify:CR=1 FL=1
MNKVTKGLVQKILNIFFNVFDIRTNRIDEKFKDKLEPNEEYFNDGYKIVIAKDLWYLYLHYVEACRDLKVNYKVVDITKNSWLEELDAYNPDAIVARPTVLTRVHKEVFDRRLYVIGNILNINVFPKYEGLWFWESKHRMNDWLKAHQYKTPRTWVFSNLDEAIEFSESCKLPMVFKSESGSGGRGVKVFKERKALHRFIKKYFRSGFITPDRHKMDLEWGSLFLQEFIAQADEWRIMRIGNSYFGYKKLPVNGIHSGSTKWEYGAPPISLLNECKAISDQNQLYSVAVDYFVSQEGAFINEVQVYFGMEHKSEMCVVDDKPGRFVINDGNWLFEEGTFCKNNLCNERVKFLIEQLDNQKET